MGVISAYVFPHPPIIVPAVGQGEEEPARKTITSCRALAAEIVDQHPDVIVISSPHAYLVPDGFFITTAPELTGSMARFAAPETVINASVDQALVNEIVDRATHASIRIIGSPPQEVETFDHGTYVPLYFVAEAYVNQAGINTTAGLPNNYTLPVKVARLGMSGLSGETHMQLGRIINEATNALDKRAIYLASGDCAHRLLDSGPYGFHPDAVTLENGIIHALQSGNLNEFLDIDARVRNNGGDCGTRSFQIMTGAVSHMDYSSDLLSEEAPFGIGYCVAAIRPK